jgi:hypothetical protein
MKFAILTFALAAIAPLTHATGVFMALCSDQTGKWQNDATHACCDSIGGGKHYYETVSGEPFNSTTAFQRSASIHNSPYFSTLWNLELTRDFRSIWVTWWHRFSTCLRGSYGDMLCTLSQHSGSCNGPF